MKLLEYYEQSRPRSYETNWHHRWTCEVLERAYIERKNVIIEQPPRHGKSEIANVYAPSWRLETHFDLMVGLVTNSDNLGTKFSTAARNFCKLPLEVDRDAQWKVKGLDSLNFTYMASGIRGQITGHGFDTLILDDLLKSGLEAKSDTVRDSVWENVASAAINRLTPDGIVIALQARLHQQDTIGKLLELEHLKFLHLHLPATNDSGREAWFRDRYSGDEVVFPAYAALWPTRYSRQKLDEIRATVSPYFWNAQYQAVPSMGDLAFFDPTKMQRYAHQNCEQVWIALDANQKETAHGSYAALVCLGSFQASLKVLGVRRGRWSQPDLHNNVRDFYRSMAQFSGVLPEAVVVEDAAAGRGVIDFLGNQLPIVIVQPRGTKEDRAGAVCHLNNRVALPEHATWLAAFENELQNFPLCADKDQVDALVHGLAYASRPAEFKPRTVEFVQEYDCLDAGNYQSSFAEENSFDEHMREAESYLRWKDNQ